MSSAEQIFLKPTLPTLSIQDPSELLHGVAELLAYWLELGVRTIDEDSAELHEYEFNGVEGLLRVQLMINTFKKLPDEPASENQAFDNYPLVCRVTFEKPDHQDDIARSLFDTVIDKLQWPALLVHDMQLAYAAWDPQHGLREFPEDTSVFAIHEHIWKATSTS